MIWNREQYLAHCTFDFTGREMFSELFGPLHALEAEWRAQGASEKEIGMTAFGWDYALLTHLSGHTGAVTGITPRVLEDTPDITVSVDAMGRKTKLFKQSATIPLPLSHPVQTMDDWLKIKHWYAFSEDRVSRERLRRSCGTRGISHSSAFRADLTNRVSFSEKRNSASPTTKNRK